MQVARFDDSLVRFPSSLYLLFLEQRMVMVMGQLQGQGFQVGVGRGQQLGEGVADGHSMGGGFGSRDGSIGGCKGHRLQEGWQHLVCDTGHMELRKWKWCSSWQESW